MICYFILPQSLNPQPLDSPTKPGGWGNPQIEDAIFEELEENNDTI